MKKILLAILVILLLAFSISAYADDNTTEAPDDEEDTELPDEMDDTCEVDSDCTEENKVCIDGQCEDAEDETDDDNAEDETDDSEMDEDESEDETDDDNAEDESEDELDDADEEEVSEFISPHGAEVRLLQLERSITKNILAGGIVIDYLTEKDDSINLTELNRILNELDLLRESLADLPREGTGDELAQSYVETKKDAINLSKQFREEVRELVDAEDIQEIHQLIKEMDSAALDVLDEDVKQAVRMRNAEQIRKMLEKMGVEDEELIESIENGEATMAEVKTALKEAYKGMDTKAKIRAAIAVKQNAEKLREQHQEMVEKMREHAAKVMEQAGERAQERSQLLEKLSEYADVRGFNNRSQSLEEQADIWQARSDRLEALSERLKE